jgi:hypothetical protein
MHINIMPYKYEPKMQNKSSQSNTTLSPQKFFEEFGKGL